MRSDRYRYRYGLVGVLLVFVAQACPAMTGWRFATRFGERDGKSLLSHPVRVSFDTSGCVYLSTNGGVGGFDQSGALVREVRCPLDLRVLTQQDPSYSNAVWPQLTASGTWLWVVRHGRTNSYWLQEFTCEGQCTNQWQAKGPVAPDRGATKAFCHTNGDVTIWFQGKMGLLARFSNKGQLLRTKETNGDRLGEYCLGWDDCLYEKIQPAKFVMGGGRVDDHPSGVVSWLAPDLQPAGRIKPFPPVIDPKLTWHLTGVDAQGTIYVDFQYPEGTLWIRAYAPDGTALAEMKMVGASSANTVDAQGNLYVSSPAPDFQVYIDKYVPVG